MASRECSLCSQRHDGRGCPLPPLWRWLLIIGITIAVFLIVVAPFLPTGHDRPVPAPAPSRTTAAPTGTIASPTGTAWSPPPIDLPSPITTTSRTATHRPGK